MIDFMRPEAKAVIARWAETAVATLLTLIGLWWLWKGPGIVHIGGALLALIGGGLLFSALQRVRFATRNTGVGMVELVEGEIRYFGPRGGGIVVIDHVLALSLSADGSFWLVESFDGSILAIPRDATGAEALFDAFAALPGLDMPRLLRIIAQGPAPRARLIWRHPTRRLLT
ncbi:hypothetical protein [Pararhodobacter sp. CCB-MM2]|uniref:hypothetical protein n=1 Tax=Pararhodobacter sp. CCB-MM2 TaxID=1786003 RepID=UPI0008361B71|nr:hypothetical protein [Pararhodobacter sp. CCB-MM2]MCA2013881.1 hypothetical protein [Cereibacter sphaeroides]